MSSRPGWSTEEVPVQSGELNKEILSCKKQDQTKPNKKKRRKRKLVDQWIRTLHDRHFGSSDKGTTDVCTAVFDGNKPRAKQILLTARKHREAKNGKAKASLQKKSTVGSLYKNRESREKNNRLLEGLSNFIHPKENGKGEQYEIKKRFTIMSFEIQRR